MSVSSTTLEHFIKENDNNFSLENVELNDKQAILEYSTRQLQLPPDACTLQCIRCIRILTRDSAFTDQLTADPVLTSLVSKAFRVKTSTDDLIVLESLKCLLNLILKRHDIVPQLKTLGLVDRLCDRLKEHTMLVQVNEFLLMDSKLLFLVSAVDTSIRQDLSEKSDVFTHVKFLLKALPCDNLSCIQRQLACELLKIAYNIGCALQHDQNRMKCHLEDFIDCCQVLRGYLLNLDLSDREQFLVIQQIVNFLNVVPKRCFVHLIRREDQSAGYSKYQSEMAAIQKLLDYLDIQLPQLPTDPIESMTLARSSRLDESLCPILNTLIRGCQGNRSIRKYCRSKVLPHLGDDVKRLPEQGSTLRNRLCKLLTNPLHGVSELVALFIFVLCKEDIGRAIKYTGFGNFSGFLARHALLGGPSKKRSRAKSATQPSTSLDATTTVQADQTEQEHDSAEEYSSDSSQSDTEEYERLKNSVNPVTGRWETEKVNPLEGLSEEQKEYIAMELVRDIDRLQRSGIIQPGKISAEGRVQPAEHVLQLLEGTHTPEQSDTD